MIARYIAMSLYQYNVNAFDRATRLYEHFRGNCAEMPELLRWVDSKHWSTEMPYPTAKVYAEHAVERYGPEAVAREITNSKPFELMGCAECDAPAGTECKADCTSRET